LPGLANAERIESSAQPLHAINFFRAEHFRQVIALFNADPVFSVIEPPISIHMRRMRPANASARSKRTRFAPIKEDQRVQVAVAGVKDVRAAQAGLARHFADPPAALLPIGAEEHTIPEQ